MATDTKMFMGLPETSNADGPIGFVDIPTTNDRMVGRDFFIAKRLTWLSGLAGVVGVITFVVHEFGYLELSWVILAMFIFFVAWTINVWYFANYRGQQKQERDQLQTAAIHIQQLVNIKEALQATAKIAEADMVAAATMLPPGGDGAVPDMDVLFGDG